MCEGVGYELSPADGWAGGSAMDEELAADWIRRLATNVDTLCFEAVGVSVDHLKGIEWLNGIGRAAMEGCVIVDMQKEDEVKMIRGLMGNPGCLWLQVDMGGGRWEPCDAPVCVEDGWVAAGESVAVGVVVGGTVEEPPAPPVALAIRNVADGLVLMWDGDYEDSGSDVDMESSPLRDRAKRRLGVMRRGSAGSGAAAFVVLFPAVPILPVEVARPVCKETVPDSVDRGDLVFNEDLGGDGTGLNDPACGRDSRAGGYECSC